MFHSLANLPCDYGTIAKSLTKRTRRHLPSTTSTENLGELPSMEGSHPALPAEPGTLKATLPDTPGIVTRIAAASDNPGVVTRTATLPDTPFIVKKDSYTYMHNRHCNEDSNISRDSQVLQQGQFNFQTHSDIVIRTATGPETFRCCNNDRFISRHSQIL